MHRDTKHKEGGDEGDMSRSTFEPLFTHMNSLTFTLFQLNSYVASEITAARIWAAGLTGAYAVTDPQAERRPRGHLAQPSHLSRRPEYSLALLNAVFSVGEPACSWNSANC